MFPLKIKGYKPFSNICQNRSDPNLITPTLLPYSFSLGSDLCYQKGFLNKNLSYILINSLMLEKVCSVKFGCRKTFSTYKEDVIPVNDTICIQKYVPYRHNRCYLRGRKDIYIVDWSFHVDKFGQSSLWPNHGRSFYIWNNMLY